LDGTWIGDAITNGHLSEVHPVNFSIEEAMNAHTMGGAFADFAENEKGSLESGKFADLIVWSADPYRVDTRHIIDLTVDLTMVGRKIVHEV
jgi:predicted amidohydrolase YtcJ